MDTSLTRECWNSVHLTEEDIILGEGKVIKSNHSSLMIVLQVQVQARIEVKRQTSFTYFTETALTTIVYLPHIQCSRNYKNTGLRFECHCNMIINTEFFFFLLIISHYFHLEDASLHNIYTYTYITWKCIQVDIPANYSAYC